MYEDDMDMIFDLPGGDNFDEITDLFDAAATEMEPSEVIFAEGFTLHDSMSAFEIGEPRMDSGMVVETDNKPSFDPLTPLLPRELCWMLDRSFACEMAWHGGNTLSQTVYTLLYVHHLPHIDPEMIRYAPHLHSTRFATEIITVVLRSAVVGLLKCCDLAWRELSKGKVQDTEDWQGEKCDISILEGTPSELAVRMLEDACSWLQISPLSPDDKAALIDRILLRKSLLELLRLRLPTDLQKTKPLILMTRNILRRIRSRPEIIAPPPTSLASDAFDPHITRRLHSFIPIRIVELPTQEQTWDTIEALLQGWETLEHLLASHSLFAWNICGVNLATYHRTSPPFIRSLTQSALQDRNLIFGVYPAIWIVEHYFAETLGVSYEALSHTMRVHWTGTGTFSMKETERHIFTIIINLIKSHSYNPPRRRRYLMKSVLEWQVLHDGLRSLTAQLNIDDAHTQTIVDAVVLTARLWQASVAQEIILSGFQQELYTADERPVAYWYAAQVIKISLGALDVMRKVAPQDTHACTELRFQTDYLTGLQAMCIASCVLSYKPDSRPAERMATNFRKRYKWLFTQAFPSNEEELLLPVPDFKQFVPSVTQLLSFSVADCFASAKENLLKAANMDVRAFIAPEQAAERLEYVHRLSNLCEQLGGSKGENLRWDPSAHPWFPVAIIDPCDGDTQN
ncbi:Mak10-domain-containing protein [Cristinia sonorae]|uniref:Mak10-domain-containing protein n=1 Tax=Cristinia sonorae TaxID=1940300 RepID=A0A8K0XPH8_9AGAR|nr:Mak10-domain-containing protein [Cristinia sonorae]